LGNYEDRLVLWNQLRTENIDNDLESALVAINDWWQLLPIDSPYLHWKDEQNWPDPWDILADGVFCDLTKCLGIVYTLFLVDRSEIKNIDIVITDEGDNLVFVNDDNYVLNYCPGEILQKPDIKSTVIGTIDASIIKHKIG